MTPLPRTANVTVAIPSVVPWIPPIRIAMPLAPEIPPPSVVVATGFPSTRSKVVKATAGIGQHGSPVETDCAVTVKESTGIYSVSMIGLHPASIWSMRASE